MENYARDNAAKAGLGATSSLRVVHGVSEALPLASKSCDAVVCSLTLCSVVDPARSVAEIKRVLRPGGQFVFWEHVLSETDPSFAEEQVRATPMQIKRADGCHLDRRTGDIIRKAGFRSCDLSGVEGLRVPESDGLRYCYGISICFVTTRHRRPEIKSKPTYAEGRGHASLDVQVRVLRAGVIGVDAELLVERLLVEDDHDVVREARRDLHH